MKFRTAANGSIGGLSISSTGKLSYRNDVTGVTTTSATVVTRGVWQTLEVHLHIADTASQIETWYNGVKVSDLSKTDSLGTNPIGILQLGENTALLTYDVALDDISATLGFITMAAVSTSPSALSIMDVPTNTPTPTVELVATSTPVQATALSATPASIPSNTPVPTFTSTTAP